MDFENSALIVIPARGGSKRLPRKNILPLCEKPLINWSVDIALSVKFQAQVLVTSDSEEILDTVKKEFGKRVLVRRRPNFLATDDADTESVLLDAIESISAGNSVVRPVILLQPTCPLRTANDIQDAYAKFLGSSGSTTLVSVTELEHPSAWNAIIEDNGRLKFSAAQLRNSQFYRKEVRLNGSIYIFNSETLRSTGTMYGENVIAFEMPKERSIDIDTLNGFELAEYYMTKHMRQ